MGAAHLICVLWLCEDRESISGFWLLASALGRGTHPGGVPRERRGIIRCWVATAATLTTT